MVTPVLNAGQRSRVLLLQRITLGWMFLESTLSLASALRAHSPALAAFGADSLVELLSAVLVMASVAPRWRLPERTVDRLAGVLLYALAAAVALTSVLALAGRLRSESSPVGIAVTLAALFVMPVLAWRKRHLAREINHSALAADAVQSATCAYLAAITLLGLLVNAIFHLPWADAAAALLAVPVLLVEARRAWRGQSCGCGRACE